MVSARRNRRVWSRSSRHGVPPVAAAVLAAACAAGTLAAPSAAADPLPGFDLSAEKLRERMDQCIAYAIGEHEVLMGWLHARSGEGRQWRCSSLRHMFFDDRPGGAHNPYTDVAGFMRCADRTVSFGFVRDASQPAYKRHIYQYRGTDRSAQVVYDENNGDIVTIFTNPENDWAECATWRP